MLAIPHYIDLGLLLVRTDLTVDGRDPTHWEELGDPTLDESSFERIASRLSRRLKVPGFAFDMESVDTTACVFVEMCWNFFAQRSFLKERTVYDLAAATRALQFLARLRWNDVLPYPCTLKDCARSVYVRAWYANVPALAADAARPPPLRPIEFLTSGQFAAGRLADVRDRLIASERMREASFREKSARLAREQQSQTAYQDVLATAALRQEVDRGLAAAGRRIQELKNGKVGGWSCSGAWYLGVVSSGGNTNLGWSIVQEALDQRRIADRAMRGAGLPPTTSFYRDNRDAFVPGLTDVTFGRMESFFFGRTRRRELALGLGLGAQPTQPIQAGVVRLCREMPELLHALVIRILGDDRSNPDNAGSEGFIRDEVGRVFSQIGAALE
jgi:hypothetical protein